MSGEDPDARKALGLAVSGLSDESKISRAFIDQEIVKGLEDSLHLSAVMFNRISLHVRKRTAKE